LSSCLLRIASAAVVNITAYADCVICSILFRNNNIDLGGIVINSVIAASARGAGGEKEGRKNEKKGG
jgi:hypothetical protein